MAATEMPSKHYHHHPDDNALIQNCCVQQSATWKHRIKHTSPWRKGKVMTRDQKPATVSLTKEGSEVNLARKIKNHIGGVQAIEDYSTAVSISSTWQGSKNDKIFLMLFIAEWQQLSGACMCYIISSTLLILLPTKQNLKVQLIKQNLNSAGLDYLHHSFKRTS